MQISGLSYMKEKILRKYIRKFGTHFPQAASSSTQQHTPDMAQEFSNSHISCILGSKTFSQKRLPKLRKTHLEG